ncbi:hypothetical protein AVEN_53710-1 [Araneus ventricosus]|uniref:Uncharacterized protein n=1 Tax=Araneus ventricosus TaxID=182803 RepID=A0A4Y2SXT3_ARAVE|nr:hypothetical protein AVEN_53710-1 [Araneus ventricosus]
MLVETSLGKVPAINPAEIDAGWLNLTTWVSGGWKETRLLSEKSSVYALYAAVKSRWQRKYLNGSERTLYKNDLFSIFVNEPVICSIRSTPR